MTVAETSSSTSKSLIERARKLEPEAWQRLADLFGPMVYRWGRKSGLQSSDAADVMQEVFRAVAANIRGFDRSGPGHTFRGWLWTITRNKIRDHFRRQTQRPEAAGGTVARQRLEQLPEAPADSSAEQSSHFNLATKQVLELVKADFEQPTWQAFWETAVEDKKPADVAVDLGMNVSAVYMAKSRVLRRLRTEMNELLGEPPQTE